MPEPFDVGLMRHRVSLQSATTARGPTGQENVAWSTTGTYWARVQNLSGAELINAAQIKNTVRHKITMRADVGPIAVSQRLLFEGTGRAFNVEAVLPDERNAYVELWCSELAAQP